MFYKIGENMKNNIIFKVAKDTITINEIKKEID